MIIKKKRVRRNSLPSSSPLFFFSFSIFLLHKMGIIERERKTGDIGRMGEMSEKVKKAVRCLGRGFDINSDFRLKYRKGHERLVVLNEEKAELAVPGIGAIKDVSTDIKCDKGDRIRYQSDVLDYTQMSELLNQRSSIAGRFPSGMFNHAYGFSGGSWSEDAKRTRCLAFDGCFISLFNLRIHRYPLTLSDDVVGAVPSTWNPIALTRFIKRFGTHVITGLSMGGRDVVFVRQDQSSILPTSELRDHLDKLGDQLFSGTCTLPLHSKNKENRQKPPEAFNVFNNDLALLNDGSTSVSSKRGITVICSKRGGDASARGHSEWLLTVPTAPDVINFTFMPITSLLTDVPGKGFLSHAISLYLRYKPPMKDLEYFLDFQSHKIWAPMHNDLPLGPSSNRTIQTASLQFNMMGPKLFVNTNQVVVGTAPVTGMRLYLEGKRNNRLAVHLQHLSSTPNFITEKMHEALLQREAECGTDEKYYAPVLKKKFSHVCTAPVKYDPGWRASEVDAAFIVTGAQLLVKRHGYKNVLHLVLTYSTVSGFFVERSVWEQGPSTLSQKSGFFSTLSSTFSGGIERERLASDAANPAVVVNSGVFPTGPPVPVQEQKLLKFVDTSQICKGPQDTPGHWLVTGARLELNKGRICLNVKFSHLGSSLTTN